MSLQEKALATATLAERANIIRTKAMNDERDLRETITSLHMALFGTVDQPDDADTAKMAPGEGIEDTLLRVQGHVERISDQIARLRLILAHIGTISVAEPAPSTSPYIGGPGGGGGTSAPWPPPGYSATAGYPERGR